MGFSQGRCILSLRPDSWYMWGLDLNLVALAHTYNCSHQLEMLIASDDKTHSRFALFASQTCDSISLWGDRSFLAACLGRAGGGSTVIGRHDRVYIESASDGGGIYWCELWLRKERAIHMCRVPCCVVRIEKVAGKVYLYKVMSGIIGKQLSMIVGSYNTLLHVTSTIS